MEPNLRSRISLRSIQATKRRSRVTEERKPGPTPALSLDRTGFALDVTIFLPACDPFAIVRTTERGRNNAPRDGGVWP